MFVDKSGMYIWEQIRHVLPKEPGLRLHALCFIVAQVMRLYFSLEALDMLKLVCGNLMLLRSDSGAANSFSKLSAAVIKAPVMLVQYQQENQHSACCNQAASFAQTACSKAVSVGRMVFAAGLTQ